MSQVAPGPIGEGPCAADGPVRNTSGSPVLRGASSASPESAGVTSPGLVPVIDSVHLTKHNLTAGIDADRWFRERITACC